MDYVLLKWFIFSLTYTIEGEVGHNMLKTLHKNMSFRNNHRIPEVLSALEHFSSVTVLSLKGTSEGGGR